MKLIKYEDFIDYKNSKDAYLTDFENHPLKNLITKYVKEGPVLDVGCGNGNLINLFKDKFKVEGFDASEIAINQARRRGLNVKVSTINEYNPDKLFKSIIMIDIFNHLPDYEKDFKKIISWLDKEGRVYITVSNPNSLKRKLSLTKDLRKWGRFFCYFTHQQFKEFAEKNKLKIVNAIGCGRIKYPILSTTILYILEKN